MSKRIVIVGGGAGGMTTATQVKKRMPDAEVVVFEKTQYVSWAGCPTPYYIANELPQKSVLHQTAEYFTNERGISTYINHSVERIDFEKNEIIVSGDEINGNYKYDELVLSVGNNSFIPPVKGYSEEVEGVFKLSHVTDAFKIKKYIDEKKPAKGVIIGGGFIGVEMAETFQKRGIKTDLVEMESEILPKFDFNLKKSIIKKAKEKEINFNLGKYVVEIKKENNKVKSIVLNTGEEIETNIILMSVGVRPNLEILNNSNYELKDNILRVNDYLQMNYKNVYAIGDMIFTKNKLTGEEVYAPFGDVADKQAIIVAKNIAGQKRKYKGVMGTFASSFYDIKIAKTGFSINEAKKAGFEAKSITVSGITKALSFKEKGGGKMEIVYDVKLKKILGAAMVGNEAIAQFIDQVAIVISNDLSLEDIFDVDYAYSPTNSSVWNPLLTAYRKLIE